MSKLIKFRCYDCKVRVELELDEFYMVLDDTIKENFKRDDDGIVITCAPCAHDRLKRLGRVA